MYSKSAVLSNWTNCTLELDKLYSRTGPTVLSNWTNCTLELDQLYSRTGPNVLSNWTNCTLELDQMYSRTGPNGFRTLSYDVSNVSLPVPHTELAV